MCGIAGCVRRRGGVKRETLATMLDLLRHRGPDSEGIFAHGRGAVAQTRLAIIDLETGDPPIHTPDGNIGVALNGEIYNFAALRAALHRDGHRFATRGDTEVIAHLAERLEPVDLARKLEGMFAAAVWDASRERLVLIRDRLGKKPLYWWRGSNVIVFASEIKALLDHPDVVADLDESALCAYLHVGYVPTPGTFFKEIRSVPPGHVLTVGPDFDVTITPYWSIPRITRSARLDVDLHEGADLVLACLREAVADRLIGDVPVGAFLSGGVDSSLIVALMAERAAGRVRTFTIGFGESTGDDERPWAAQVARHLGTDHTELVVEPQSIDVIDRLVWHYDQPFGDSSALPVWYLSELTRSHVTVALSGDGGDELFAGYERFTAARLGGLARGVGRPATWLADTIPARDRRSARLKRALRVVGKSPEDTLRELVAYAPADLVDELTGDRSNAAVDVHHRIWETTAGLPTLDRLLILNAETYLLDDLLPKVDRMSMAHGLEVRSPLLDHRLVELAAALPPNLKADRHGRKRVLREAARGLVPDAVLDRPKKGFGVPLDQWFRDELWAYMRDRLGAGARIREHVSGDTVDAVLAAHVRGREDHRHLLWSLLTLETFLRQRGW